MKKLLISFIIICVSICFGGTSYAGDTYKIGVLAKNGPVKALKMWKSTGEYLSGKLSGSFEIVPLDFEAVFPAIQKGNVDFFLVNSSMFITAKVKYGATEIATMINSRQGKPLKSFGGVIFTSEENDEIKSISDLSGKTFMAVKKSSFGGWQMAYMELLKQGINPFKDFKSLEFGGKHDNVVLAIQNGAVDAGTVRTDTLERMVATGMIDLSEFKIISQKKHGDFPFVVSTALYPEWPLAKTKTTSKKIADQVVAALKQLKPTDTAAKNAKIMGWTNALDYTGVEDLQKKLKVGAYK